MTDISNAAEREGYRRVRLTRVAARYIVQNPRPGGVARDSFD